MGQYLGERELVRSGERGGGGGGLTSSWINDVLLCM